MATLRRGITPPAFPPVPPPPQAGTLALPSFVCRYTHTHTRTHRARHTTRHDTDVDGRTGSASPRNSPASVPRLPVASSPRGLTNATLSLPPPPSGLVSPRHSLNQRLTADGATRPTSLSQRVPPVVESPDDRALPPLPPAPLLEGDDYDDRSLPPPPLPRTAGTGGPAGFTPPLRPAPSPRGVVPPSPGRAMPGPGGPSPLRAVGAPPSPLSPRPPHAFQPPADRDLPPPPPRYFAQAPLLGAASLRNRASPLTTLSRVRSLARLQG
jgi:hypothetical protein